VVSSDGVLPVSVAVHDSLVYVANGPADRDYTGFRLTPGGTSQIDSFTVGLSGRLTAAPGSPFTAQGVGPFDSQFRPTNPSQLFVSNAHNGTGLGMVSAFTESSAGCSPRSGTHRSLSSRWRRAGSRSARTAATCSRSTAGIGWASQQQAELAPMAGRRTAQPPLPLAGISQVRRRRVSAAY
jgi:hypothetical protein